MTSSPPQNRNLQGVFWKILSCLCFALLNANVRYLTGGSGHNVHPLTPAQLTFLQNMVACFFLIPWLWQSGLKGFKTPNLMLNIIRVVSGCAGIIMLYYGFQMMPVAQAVSLQFTGPIFTAIGAYLYLKEPLGPLRTLGVALGLIGAFIITRPDQAFSANPNAIWNWQCLLPVASALMFAIAKIIGRKLALKGESAQVLTTYLIVFMVPVSFGPALYNWSWPVEQQWGYILLMGLFSWAGHYSMARSYALADVLFLTPFGFSRILLSAAIAYLLFQEIPKSSAFWMGTAVIMISGVLITLGEKNSKNKSSSKDKLKNKDKPKGQPC